MKKITLGVFALLAGASVASAQTVTHEFLFNSPTDPAQTGLQAATNTGTASTETWNFDIKDGALIQGATDGSAFVIGADATAGTTTITKDYTRKVIFGSAVTAGAYELEVVMASWDLTSGVANEGFTFKLLDSANGSSVNQVFAVNAGATDVRVRHAISAGTNPITATAAQANVGFSGSGSNLIWKVAGNLTTGAFATSYSADGTTFIDLITDGANLTSFDQLLFAPEGTTAWNAASVTKIDSITLTSAIPEPGAYAMLAGLCALTFVMVRRRK